jgi:MFS family permease
MRHAVAALGATQIIGYGSLFYAFPLLAPAMAAESGQSEAWLYAALSVGLLAGGLVAPWAGRAMDRIGAARLMTWGSALATLNLAALALAPATLWALAPLIAATQIVAVAVTYDAAFATLATLRGAGARRAITRLTLIAGLASTLFWPLTGWLVEGIGWRLATLGYAALHLILALPLHAALARTAPDPAPTPGHRAPGPAFDPLPPESRARAFALLAWGFTLSGVLIGALGVHLVPVLLAMGFGPVAYVAGMVMGPMQVAIRAVDAVFWGGIHPVTVALLSAGLVAVAVPVLLVAPASVAAAIAFAALFGAGQGLSSIVRGSVPLVLFGTAGYGALLGRLTAIRQVAGALAPLAFAVLLAQLSPAAALTVAGLVGLAALPPLWLLRAEVARARTSG